MEIIFLSLLEPSDSYGSGSDMMKVMSELTAYYYQFYSHMRSDASNASANAQVSFGTVFFSIYI